MATAPAIPSKGRSLFQPLDLCEYFVQFRRSVSSPSFSCRWLWTRPIHLVCHKRRPSVQRGSASSVEVTFIIVQCTRTIRGEACLVSRTKHALLSKTQSEPRQCEHAPEGLRDLQQQVTGHRFLLFRQLTSRNKATISRVQSIFDLIHLSSDELKHEVHSRSTIREITISMQMVCR